MDKAVRHAGKGLCVHAMGGRDVQCTVHGALCNKCWIVLQCCRKKATVPTTMLVCHTAGVTLGEEIRSACAARASTDLWLTSHIVILQ